MDPAIRIWRITWIFLPRYINYHLFDAITSDSFLPAL